MKVETNLKAGGDQRILARLIGCSQVACKNSRDMGAFNLCMQKCMENSPSESA
ncbi:MAG: hypothetical protein HY675_27380 [Chloroflexi bacterium]|nr:hypothetical protein [Chloroflexota bacterium]